MPAKSASTVKRFVPGFITDGNSKLVGNARLRQVRVQRDSCQIADTIRKFVADCHAPYSWEVEDMGSYEPGWNSTMEDDSSVSASSPWKYQTQAQLRAYPIWGKMVLYRGGGFVADLGPDLQNASRYVHWQTGLILTEAINLSTLTIYLIYNSFKCLLIRAYVLCLQHP